MQGLRLLQVEKRGVPAGGDRGGFQRADRPLRITQALRHHRKGAHAHKGIARIAGRTPDHRQGTAAEKKTRGGGRAAGIKSARKAPQVPQAHPPPRQSAMGQHCVCNQRQDDQEADRSTPPPHCRQGRVQKGKQGRTLPHHRQRAQAGRVPEPCLDHKQASPTAQHEASWQSCGSTPCRRPRSSRTRGGAPAGTPGQGSRGHARTHAASGGTARATCTCTGQEHAGPTSARHPACTAH